ncbi:MAG: hypothetical protein QOE45_2022 [Frankiaceae bacterium]|jgi:hypothetical protein|nr:hypothetical protein [Frankiaceae bacterium]
MNTEDAALLRAAFEGTAFDDAVVDFASALGTAPTDPGGLLLVGTPDEEPWHFAAHLTDEAEWAGRAELSPTLVRWAVPEGAPAHLAVGLDRLHVVHARETLLVVAPGAAPERLLDDVDRARRGGAHVLAVEAGDKDLRGLAHEALTVPVAAYFDVVQHVLSATAPGAVRRRRGVRERLGRLLDDLQGVPRPPR